MVRGVAEGDTYEMPCVYACKYCNTPTATDLIFTNL